MLFRRPFRRLNTLFAPVNNRGDEFRLEVRGFHIQLLLVFLFFTGAASLILEVAWIRRITLLVGGTTYSVSLVVATFLLCLSLGALLMGRVADRTSRPLRWYGGLEIGIGLYALLFPSGISMLEPWFRGLSHSPLRFVLAGLVLSLPTLAMGATFPLVCRWAVRMGRHSAGASVGLVGGVNTLGAAFGSMTAGLLLIRVLGIGSSIRFAGCLALGVGIAAWFLGNRMKLAGEEEGLRTPIDGSHSRSRYSGLLWLVTSVTGLLGLSLQVLWSRSLAFFLGGVTYTYSAVLSSFLVGLCAGSILIPRLSWARRAPLSVLGWCQLAAAATAVVPVLGQPMDGLLRILIQGQGMTYPVAVFVISFGAVVVPAFFLGGSLPLLVSRALEETGQTGRGTAWLYAVHHAGGALGSVLLGFLAFGLLGLKGASVLMLVSAAALGAGLVLMGEARRFVRWGAFGMATGVVFWVFFGIAPTRPAVSDSFVLSGDHRFDRQLLEFREGANTAVSVVNNLRSGGGVGLYTDGFEAAGTSEHYRYMRMLGHLPVLLSPSPKRALVIGFGSGTTAGAISLHDEVTDLEIAEISKEVLEVEHYFSEVNNQVLSRRDGVTCRVTDGRKVLFSEGEPYDLVSLEPLMPYTPAAVHLYTRDFYEVARSRLTDQGILCQWIPIHAISLSDMRILVRSFTEVFPETGVWVFEHSAVLIGMCGKFSIPFESFFARCQEPDVLTSLTKASVRSPYGILAALVLTPDLCRKFVADAPVMTDDWPILEYSPLPRFALTSYLCDNLATFLAEEPSIGSVLDLSGVSDASRETIRSEAGLYARSMRCVLEARYHRSRGMLSALSGNPRAADESRKEERVSLDRSLLIYPGNQLARDLLQQTTVRDLLMRGVEALGEGDLGRATELLAGAARTDPGSEMAFLKLGIARFRADDLSGALASFEKVLELYEREPSALYYSAGILSLQGRKDEAKKRWDLASEQGPPPLDDPDLFIGLGR